MFKFISITSIAVLFSVLSQGVMAGPDCTTEDKSKWMSELDMQRKIVNEYGFSMRKFKTTDGNCYEIYGYAPSSALKNVEKDSDDKYDDDRDDSKYSGKQQKVEIYFNPVDGSIVKTEIED